MNKELGKASCVPYIVADAVPTSEQTVIDQGLGYVVLRSYPFQPENVERWHGTVTRSLQQSAQQRDILGATALDVWTARCGPDVELLTPRSEVL